MRNPGRCDDALRLMTNRSFFSIELHASDLARRDSIAEAAASSLIAQREFVRDELIASVARFAADKTCTTENRWTDCLCSDLQAKLH